MVDADPAAGSSFTQATTSNSSTAPQHRTVIVGAGHAGRQCAASLCQFGYRGEITLLDLESNPLYEKPPLSKGYLRGEEPEEELYTRSPAMWQELGVRLLFDTTALKIDSTNQILHTTSGSLPYNALVWATGGEPRKLPLPGFDSATVHSLRTRNDAARLKTVLHPGTRLAIVGGGYIGLELAASARLMGVEVEVFEAQDRLLARVTSPPVSDFFRRLHETEGTTITLACTITELMTSSSGGHVLKFKNTQDVSADVVVVGAGVAPRISILSDAGALTRNGVSVDDQCRTSLPGIYAIGDIAERPTIGSYDTPLRIESVHNANETAKIVAASIAGAPIPPATVPWFWSHQFAIKLQTAGVFTGADRYLIRGDIAAGSFSIVYLKKNRLWALDAVARVADFAAARRLIGQQTQASDAEICDAARPLASLFEQK